MSAIQGDSTQMAAKALGLALGILAVVLGSAISRFNREVRWQLRASAAGHLPGRMEAGPRRVRVLMGVDEPGQSKER
jgi:hypothetical protein